MADFEDGAKEVKADFVPSEGLTSAEAAELLIKHGRNELEEKTTPKWLIYLQQLKGPMPIMIWIAIAVEAGIQNFVDMGILLGIQFANATISWYETTKAGDAVAALKASLKPLATVKRNGKWENINAGEVVPGDLVLLASGSAVPADCLVNHGTIDVDQAALTGESLPVTMGRGESAKMGSTVVRGEVEGTVEFTGKDTFFGKTAALLNTASNQMGNLQKILLKVMIVLLTLSFLLCGIALIYLLVKPFPEPFVPRDFPTSEFPNGPPNRREINLKFKEVLQFVIVLLVASIPIAIEIVCTTTLALGSRQLSVHGAIVTRLAAIEEMAGMNMLCSDKTGTLTLNKMVIQDDCPTFNSGATRETVVRDAALAAKWKEPPRDALDTLVLGVADLPSLDVYTQTEYMPFDPTQKRTEGTLRGPDGKVFKTTKGAPHIILDLSHNRDEIHQAVDMKVHELGTRGIRSLAVARTDDQDRWCFQGILTFLDPPRPDTKRTIERSMEFGVDVKMITGDHKVIAVETARVLGLGTNIAGADGLPTMVDGKIPANLGKNYGKMIIEADGFAQVFPEHKYLIVEALRQNGFACGMTGDGVNDAPALKRADVGIAVSGATDAARAAADIVLTHEGLSVVVEAIIIARQIFQRIKNFLTYRMAATLQLLTFFFIAVFALEPHKYQPACIEATANTPGCREPEWPEFFQLPVIMLMLITLLNDGTLISIGYDRVIPSNHPEKWNLRVLFLIASVLGAVAMASSLLLLWGALDSHNQSDGMFHAFGLPPMPYGQIITMIYLKVSISDFLTLFSSRTESWFWTSRPAPVVLGGATLALTISTILACVWPKGTTDHVPAEGLARGTYHLWAIWVWIYCIVWWFIQDFCKVVVYRLVKKYNVFNINTAVLINARGHSDVQNDLVRTSLGRVENKLVAVKVENAMAEVDKAARAGGAVELQKVSAQLHLARASLGGGGAPVDPETGLRDLKESMEGMQSAAASLPAGPTKDSLMAQLAGVENAARRLERTSAVGMARP